MTRRSATKKKRQGTAELARDLNAQDAGVLAVMALNDHLMAANKLLAIARLTGAGEEADRHLQRWIQENLPF